MIEYDGKGHLVDCTVAQHDQQQTWTVFGHWEDDKIVVEDVLLGDHQDTRPESCKWDQGLFAASAAGRTKAEAIACIRAEYEDDATDAEMCIDPFDEGCTEPLDDGEGWNGACGTCADREYAIHRQLGQAHAGPDWVVLFYDLPVRDVVDDVSTDDGQEVIDVPEQMAGDRVLLTVYTKRSDNRTADVHNRLKNETRCYATTERIELAVFKDTTVDLSNHPHAGNLRVRDGGTGKYRPIERAEWLALNTSPEQSPN
ncbi:hypothetical protein [Mycobacteroides abscessus]|uniref:Uncharacterized protein n=1 Tax=Mycobacteroides abscessus TaxID=36809 RepID=A0A0U0ZUF0_9MYCO|nr:hypothetical protein [Mycobacteroides abscessus]CPV67156.1 Uncharacterised protein [Mycobacteroides abscessus]